MKKVVVYLIITAYKKIRHAHNNSKIPLTNPNNLQKIIFVNYNLSKTFECLSMLYKAVQSDNSAINQLTKY